MQCHVDSHVTYGLPWSNIRQTIRSMFSRPCNHVSAKLWYSIMAAGNYVRDENNQRSETVSANHLREEIIAAIEEINTLFDVLFCNTYTSYGCSIRLLARHETTVTELGTSIGSDSALAPYSLLSGPGEVEKLGDLRISLSGSALFAYPPSTHPNTVGDVGGDIRINNTVNWRPYRSEHTAHCNPINTPPCSTTTNFAVSKGSFSLSYVLVHHLFHALGIGHDSTDSSLMSPRFAWNSSLRRCFPNGLEDTQAAFILHKLYIGDPFLVAMREERLYFLDGASALVPCPDSLQELDGCVVKISVNPAGVLWGVTRYQRIVYRQHANPCLGVHWREVDGRLVDLSAGALLIGVNVKKEVYVRVGEGLCGSEWLEIKGKQLDSVAVSPAAWHGMIAVYGICRGRVCFRDKVTFCTPTGDIWRCVKGDIKKAKKVAIGWFGKQVLCLTYDGLLYIRRGITQIVPHGETWEIVTSSSRLIDICLSPTGDIYAINSKKHLLCRTGVTFDQLGGVDWVLSCIDNVHAITAGINLSS